MDLRQDADACPDLEGVDPEFEFEDVMFARRLRSSESPRVNATGDPDPDELRSRRLVLVLLAQARADLISIAASQGIALVDGPGLADFVLADLHPNVGIEHRDEPHLGHLGQFTVLGSTLALTAAAPSDEQSPPWMKVTQARRPEPAELRRRRRRSYDPVLGVGAGLEVHVVPSLPFGEERRLLPLLLGEAISHQKITRGADGHLGSGC